MRCVKCGFVTSWKRIRCPKCGSEMTEFRVNDGVVLESWKLYVTPEGFEESYHINLVDIGQGKIMCKSKERLSEGSKVIIEGDTCKSI